MERQKVTKSSARETDEREKEGLEVTKCRNRETNKREKKGQKVTKSKWS